MVKYVNLIQGIILSEDIVDLEMGERDLLYKIYSPEQKEDYDLAVNRGSVFCKDKGALPYVIICSSWLSEPILLEEGIEWFKEHRKQFSGPRLNIDLDSKNI